MGAPCSARNLCLIAVSNTLVVRFRCLDGRLSWATNQLWRGGCGGRYRQRRQLGLFIAETHSHHERMMLTYFFIGAGGTFVLGMSILILLSSRKVRRR